MNFVYETQGAITYLVCELDDTEQVDSITLGMLTNNHIVGFAPMLYTEMDGRRYLKYNVSARLSAEKFFGATVNRERVLNAFHNILSAICSADEYMIDLNSFALDPEHVFLNVSSCESSLICIPAANEKDVNEECRALFRKIMFTAHFDSGENADYITKLITYINGDSFTVYGLKDLVAQLKNGTPSPAANASAPTAQPNVRPNIQPNIQSNVQSGVQPNIQQTPQRATVQPTQTQNPAQTAAPRVQAPASVSALDSTISIDDMPAMAAVAAQQNIQTQPRRTNATTPIPSINNAPRANVAPNTQNAANRPPVGNVPINNGARSTAQVPPRTQQTQPAMQRPPMPGTPGFAIPGQGQGIASKQKTPPAPVGNTRSDGENGGKKISLLGLLSHYNKENAELYKKQKEDAKAAKNAAKAAKTDQTAPQAAGGVPNRPNGQGVNARVPYAQPQYTQPQYVQPRPQPVPVQNSFNETTVLTPDMAMPATTVLGTQNAKPTAYLMRSKTGEEVAIDKPVFRIGKEKSYVDYFIADNTAISRSHANIHIEKGEYFIEDTNSTNHTYVNGMIINSNVKIKLSSGDGIRFANEDFTFTIR